MAGMGEWVKALRNLGIDKMYDFQSTVETYREIETMGLPGITFESFETTRESELTRIASRFISSNKPCLFIWDPKNPNGDLSKDYRTDLIDSSFVKLWTRENRSFLGDYRYLLTDQVTGSRRSFVGTAYSNGKGDLFCETLHIPFVFNHRELSNKNSADSSNTDLFLVENFSFEGSLNGLVTRGIVRRIIELYGDKSGSFEFIYGDKKGVRDVFTTGLEKIEFPRELYDSQFFSIRGS